MNADLMSEKYNVDMFDLDLEVSVEATSVSPAVTSVSVCTPGCENGTFNSFCC
ncbi:gallidermin/nisin family lantibiotic [Nocardiopsis sp. L17-MgMaSL7]|uniref:gallidermin/nisin family lantibiotic n=1 Tax=Nocardiopsis sp. L17-MgMaSL7 TaxID=1938893 RepID=UPI000D878BD7|nr:gallidermin/nisin family lantibiotic [Nocardiopsis sp. L17-MgMaSL7]PWV48517.1 gallidermin/nisin family lantibiotic [Nocardiopsis sp. L17-MgMaSL7]